MVALDVPDELNGLSGLYNSVDPLLRRIRVEDQAGHAILDLEKYFRDVEVLILYAGSEQGSVNLKELHRSLTTLALKNIKNASVIYVSTDTDPQCQERITKNVPWLRMTFNDNSDFAPLVSARDVQKIVEIEDVERGEDFVQAGEIEVGVAKVPFGTEEYQYDYVRPLSRAALTCVMRAYSTPSLSVYHIPSHTFAARNVKPEAFYPQHVEANMRLWRNGQAPSFGLLDIFIAIKWPLFALILAAIYRVLIHTGGEQYHVIPKFISLLGWQGHAA